MATSSFHKDFVVSDKQAIEQLIADLQNPVPVQYKKRETTPEQVNKILCLIQKQSRSKHS